MSQTLKELSNSQRNVDQPPELIANASTTQLLHQIDNWVSRGWLRALDRSFATFVLEQDPQAPVSYTHLTLPTNREV